METTCWISRRRTISKWRVGYPVGSLLSEPGVIYANAAANTLCSGACGGSCACSTCHVIVADSDMYDKMEEPSDDENDMLDLAFGLTETSRLGCQILMSKGMDGLVVKLPSMTRNLQASDFAKK